MMLNWLCAILLTLCLLSGILLRYMPFASIIEQKRKRILFVLYTVICIFNMALILVATQFWGFGFIANYLRFGGMILAGVLVLINILLIPGRTREQLFVFGIVLNCNYILMTIPNYIITLIPKLSPTHHLLFLLFSILGLLLVTYWPLMKLLNSTVTPFLYLDIGEYWNTLWLIPIIYFGAKYVSLGGEHNTGSVFQLASGLLSGITMIFVCLNVASGQGRVRESQNMEKQLSAQKIHYAELQTRVEEARKTNHDFKHHIAAIRHYLDIDDKEGLRRYCDDWMIRHEGRERIPYTGNSAVDGVLYQYMQQAKEQQVQFQYAGSVRNSRIADMDLCVLLGNALDNAFTACLGIPADKRSVSVICQSEETLLSIVVRNVFDGEVYQDEMGLLSRKRNNAHGIGILSMSSVCERYGGSLDIQWDETTFTVMIMLPL